MKVLSIIFKFMLLLIFLEKTLAIDAIKNSIDLEEQIKRNLLADLSLVLPNSTYAVFVTVLLNSKKIDKVNQRQKTQKSERFEEKKTLIEDLYAENNKLKSKANEKTKMKYTDLETDIESLPGFDEIVNPLGSSLEGSAETQIIKGTLQAPPENQNKFVTNEVVSYKTFEEIEFNNVDIKLLLDESISKGLFDSLSTLLKAKLKNKYGSKFSLEVLKIPMLSYYSAEKEKREKIIEGIVSQKVKDLVSQKTKELNERNKEIIQGIEKAAEERRLRDDKIRLLKHNIEEMKKEELFNKILSKFKEMKNFDIWIWMIISSLLVFFLGIIFYIVFNKRSQTEKKESRNKGNRNNNEDKGQLPILGPTPKPPTVPENGQPINTLDAIRNNIILDISNNPLASRNYLMNLSDKDKVILNSCFDTGPLKNILLNLSDNMHNENNLQFYFPDFDEDELEDQKLKSIKNISSELSQYNQVTEVQENQPFGFLLSLTVKELLQVIRGHDEIDIMIVMENLPSDKSRDLIRNLNKQQVSKVMNYLCRQDGLFLDKMTNREKELEEILKKKVLALSKHIFQARKDNMSLINYILDEVNNTKDVLNDIKNLDNNIFENFKHYMIEFEDIFTVDKADLASSLASVDNNTLAFSLAGLDKAERNNILKVLSPMRKELVNSLIDSMSVDLNDDRIIMAKKKLLKSVRIKSKKTQLPKSG